MSNPEQDVIRALAAKVAVEIGQGWRLKDNPDNDWMVDIVGPDDEEVSFGDATPYSKRHDGVQRVEIRAHLYHLVQDREEAPYGMDTKTMTAAVNRGPEAIARDIRRRLLPGYAEQIAKVKACRDRYRQDKAAAERVREELPSWIDLPGYSSATIKVRHGGDTVDMELRGIPTDVARQIIPLLPKKNDS